MSKSDLNPNSRILITDDEETTRQKFRTALTDSQEGISYDPENRPGVSNLLDILKHTKDVEMSGHDLAAEFKGSSLRSLKETVADAVVKTLAEVREKYFQLRSSQDILLDDIAHNEHRAATDAGMTLEDVKSAMGLIHIGKRVNV